MLDDRQLTDIWQQVFKKRFAPTTTQGGRNGRSLWFKLDGRRIQGRCFGDVPSGECIAVQIDSGEWVLIDSQASQPPQEQKRNLELRRTKPRPKKAIGNLQVLFFEIVGQVSEGQTINYYVGGDRPTPLLIHSEIYAGTAANQIEDGVFFPEFELSDLVNLGDKDFIACIGNHYRTPSVNRFVIGTSTPFESEASFFKIIYINNQATTEYNLNYLQGYDHTKAYRYLGEGCLAGTPRVVQRSQNNLLNYYQDLPIEYFGQTHYITPNDGEITINATTEEYSYSTPVPLLNEEANFNSTYSENDQLTRTFEGENLITIGRDNTKITEYLSFDQQGEILTQSREVRFYRGDNYISLNTSDAVRVNHEPLSGGNASIHDLVQGDTFVVRPSADELYFYEALAIGSPSAYFPSLVGQEVLFSNIFNNQYWLARCQVISYSSSQFTLQLLQNPSTTLYCSFGSEVGSFILNNGSYYHLIIVNDPEFAYNAIITNNYISPISNISNTTDFKKSDPAFIHDPSNNFLNPRYRQIDLFGSTSPGLDTTAYLRYTDNRYSRLVKNTFYKVKPVDIEQIEVKSVNYVETWKIVNGSVVRSGVEKVKVQAIATGTPPEDLFFRDFLDIDYSPD